MSRELSINGLIFDKNEDERLKEFGYPIVSDAQSYQKYLKSNDTAVVVINLVNLDKEDIEAFRTSKRLKNDQLLFVAIEGNVGDDVVDQLERYLAFSRKIPKEFTSKLLKFSISYSSNRQKVESMVSNLKLAESALESGQQQMVGDSDEGEQAGVVLNAMSLSIMLVVFVSIMSILFLLNQYPIVEEAQAMKGGDASIVSVDAALEERATESKLKKVEFSDSDPFKEIDTKESDEEVKILEFTNERFEHVNATHLLRSEEGPLLGLEAESNVTILDDIERYKKLAFVQIKRRHFVSDDGRSAMGYLRKIDSNTEGGFNVAGTVATEMLLAILDDYLNSAKGLDTKRMRALQSAAGVLHQYVVSNKLDILRSKSHQHQVNDFSTNMEALRRVQGNEVLINMMQEMGFLLIRMADEQEKAKTKTKSFVLDASTVADMT